MRPAEPPSPVDTDEPAAASPLFHKHVHGHLAGMHRGGRQLEDVDRPAGQHDADGGLAVARARHAARGALRIGAAADERRIADAPREFSGHSAGGRRGGDEAPAIQGDGADGAAPNGAAPNGAPYDALEAPALSVGAELLRITEGDAESPRARHGALAGEEGVPAVLEDQARQ